MDIPQRKGVSPIIATLLLIAIAVAAGVIVYVFVGGLAGSLTKSGGNQVTEQLSVDAYSFQSATAPALYLRNTGTSTLTVSSVFFDGNLCSTSSPSGTIECGTLAFTVSSPATCTGTSPAVVCASGQTTELTLALSTTSPFTAPASGSSHTVKVVTADGGTFFFNIVTGSSG